jgi:hypothetical protein
MEDKGLGYLRIKDVWKTVTVTDRLLLLATQVEDSDTESKALAYLQRLVSDTILSKIPGKNSASAIWRALEEKYRDKDVVDITILYGTMVETTLAGCGHNMEKYIETLGSIFCQFSDAGKLQK